MGHLVYESCTVLLGPSSVVCKFEWSIIKDCKRYLRECEIYKFVHAS